MARAKRVCTEPGCPVLVEQGRCLEHQRQLDRARGSRAQRGYGVEHMRLRAAERERVDAGGVCCWRCGQPIAPGQAFDLGHDDLDRRVYRGAEHVTCNRATRGRAVTPSSGRGAHRSGGRSQSEPLSAPRARARSRS